MRMMILVMGARCASVRTSVDSARARIMAFHWARHARAGRIWSVGRMIAAPVQMAIPMMAIAKLRALGETLF